MQRFFYIVLVCLLGLGFAYRVSTIDVLKIPRNQEIKLSATVKAEPRISGGWQVLEIGDGKIYVDLYPRYRVGDKVLLSGKVDADGRIFRPQIEIIDRQESLLSFFSSLRLTISQNIASFLPLREATIVSGTVLGVDTIERDFRDELVKTGTIHVVVVSGQNLMIVAGVFLSLGRYLGRRASLVFATIAVFVYVFLTGFEPPVLRASLMVLASTLAIFAGRQTSPIWQLVLAALVILFIWPQALFEVSFQLTFAATLGIMTLGQYLTKIFNFPFRLETRSRRAFLILNLFCDNAAIATSAYLFTAPIILFYFGRISPLAPIANILIAEAVFPVMILGFLVSIISLIFPLLAQVISYIAYVPAFYFVKVVEIFAEIPIEQIFFGQDNLFALFIFYILIFIFLFLWTQRAKSH